MNVIGFLLTAAVFAVLLILILPVTLPETLKNSTLLIFLAVLLIYIVLHELTHGAAYKLMTRQKLTFGMTLSVAYCGVPDIYVYRRTALISLLAPFVVFTVVFGAAAILITDPIGKILAAFMLALHVGGCVGDLYDTILFLFRFRDPLTLMRDTGPKQTIYTRD